MTETVPINLRITSTGIREQRQNITQLNEGLSSAHSVAEDLDRAFDDVAQSLSQALSPQELRAFNAALSDQSAQMDDVAIAQKEIAQSAEQYRSANAGISSEVALATQEIERQTVSTGALALSIFSATGAALALGKEITTLAIQKNELKAASSAASVALRLLPFGLVAAGGFAAFKIIGSLVSRMQRLTKESIGFAQVQIEAESQVTSALKSTGAAAQRTISDIRELSDELQKVSNFEDEKSLRAASQLLTFTNIRGATFDRALFAGADVAVRLGKDLESTMIQLGKALNDPIRGLSSLSESGIQFTDVQRDMIATMVAAGNIAGAQGVILTELETQYGGAALAARDLRSAIDARKKDNKEAFGLSIIAATNDALKEQERLLSDPVYKEFNAILGDISGSFQAAGISIGNFFRSASIGLVNFLKRSAAASKADRRAVEDILAARGGLGGRGIEITPDRQRERFLETLAPTDDDLQKIANYRQELELTRAALSDLEQRDVANRTDSNPFTFGVSDSRLNNLRERATELQTLLKSFDRGNVVEPPQIDSDEIERIDDIIRGHEAAAQAAQIYYDVLKTQGEAAADAALKQIDIQNEISNAVTDLSEKESEIVRQAILREASLSRASEAYKEQLQLSADISQQQSQIEGAIAGERQEREALFAINEKEAAVIRETNRLLDEQSEYYASMGASAQALAEADAARIVDLRRGNEALVARNRITKEIEDKQELAAAAALGDKELRVAQEVLRLRQDIADIGDEEARTLAQRTVDLDDQINKAGQFNQALSSPLDDFAENLEDAIVLGGRNGVDGLKNEFEKFIDEIKKSLFRQILAPVTDAIRNIGSTGISRTLINTPSGQSGGLQSLFGQSAGIIPSKGINQSLDKSTDDIIKSFRKISTFVAANFAGAQLGSSLGGILRPNANPDNQRLGGLFGGFIGSIFGSLFGSKSNKVGQISFDSQSGSILGQGQKDNSEESNQNLAGAREIFQNISRIVGSITDVTGGTVRDLLNVAVGSRDGIKIGLQKADESTFARFDNDATGAQAAVNEGVSLALSSLSGGGRFAAVAKSLADARVSAGDIADVIGTLGGLAESSRPQLSEYQEALKAVNAAVDGAIASANGAAAAERELNAARSEAIDSIRDQFNDDITRRLLEQTDPLRSAFDDLALNMSTLVSDAEALGVATGTDSDLSAVIANDLERFFTEALEGGSTITDLTSRLSEFQAALEELGVSADTASDSFQKAIESQQTSFDQQVQSDIGQFLNGPLDQLELLLNSQKERLESANDLGADIAEVERLTALELQDFFGGLSDRALEEVQDYLGLFEEATNSVVRNLELSRQDLRTRADSFGRIAQSFDDLSTDFTERFVAATPSESIDNLRDRSSDLLAQIVAGNESAGTALPQVLSQLVESGRQTFGNASGFQDILNFAQEINSRAADAARDVQTEAERQIAALDENNVILDDIRDILQSAASTNAIISDITSGGIASGDQLLTLIQQGAGLTAAANDNASALTITGLVAQSVAPVVTPLTDSISSFTERLSSLPSLQQLTIEAINRSSATVSSNVIDLHERVDRMETILKRQLEELERINNRAA